MSAYHELLRTYQALNTERAITRDLIASQRKQAIEHFSAIVNDQDLMAILEDNFSKLGATKPFQLEARSVQQAFVLFSDEKSKFNICLLPDMSIVGLLQQNDDPASFYEMSPIADLIASGWLDANSPVGQITQSRLDERMLDLLTPIISELDASLVGLRAQAGLAEAGSIVPKPVDEK